MKKDKYSRRTVLRVGAMGAASAAITTAFGKAAFANPNPNAGKLLLINLRGGWDGLHVVIPNGTRINGSPADIDYAASRPTLAIPFNAANRIDPGNDFCTMHPSLTQAQVSNGGLNPTITAGRLAFIHQVGLWSRTGSHFEDQRTVETGIQPGAAPVGVDSEEGWATRALSSGFDGVSISENLQQVFQTRNPARVLPHVRTILDSANMQLDYSLATSKTAIDSVYKGKLGPAAGAPFGYGLAAHYNSAGSTAHALEAYNRAVGTSTLTSEQRILTEFLTTGVYAPAGGARYPLDPNPNQSTGPYPNPGQVGLKNFGFIRTFMRNLRDAVWLLKNTDAKVVGVEFASFDTHNNQGQFVGQMPDRLQALAYGLRSVDLDTANDDITTLTFSEFGRTTDENGGKGTDHGAGSVFMAQGARVMQNMGSAVFKCEESDWVGSKSANSGDLGLTTPAANGTFVSPRQNILGLFASAMTNVLCTNPNDLTTIMPGYDPLNHTAPAFL